MTDTATTNQNEQLKGGRQVLDILREESSQWVDEAQDNVLAHVDSVEEEYKRRLRDATDA